MFDASEVKDLAGKAARGEVGLASDQELLDTVVVLESIRSLVEVTEAHLLARLDSEGICDAQCGHRTAPWLAWAADQPGGGARRRVKVARALSVFAEIDSAVIAGTLSYAHAEVIAGVVNPRNRDALVAAQGTLVGLASKLGFDAWAIAVRDLATTLDADGGYDPNEDLAANRLSKRTLADRTLEIHARLVGEHAVTVAQSIDTVADELFRRFSADAGLDPSLEVPERATLEALALAELCRRGLAVDLASTRAPRTEAVWIYDEAPFGPDGAPLPPQPRAACDHDVQAILLDSLGNPVALGARTALVTPHQRRALTVRDRGCVFPGCDRPSGWCDAHHVVFRRRGGRTELYNLALLCRHHHGVVHRAGWTMTPDGDQTFTITTPSGRVLSSRRNLPGVVPRPGDP